MMTCQVLPDPAGGFLVATDRGYVVGARLQRTELAPPDGPVSGLARLEAEIVRGKWEAYERRQEAITPRKTGREK